MLLAFLELTVVINERIYEESLCSLYARKRNQAVLGLYLERAR